MTIMMRELDKIEEGRIEGRNERSEEIAVKMLRNNEPLTRIEEYTNVALERLSEIAKSNRGIEKENISTCAVGST